MTEKTAELAARVRRDQPPILVGAHLAPPLEPVGQVEQGISMTATR